MTRAPRGQNFLVSRAYVERIVAAAEPDGETVLEIGPGKGALTGPLAARAKRVVAVELDAALARALQHRAPENLSVLCADARTVERAAIAEAARGEPANGYLVVANLPYYAATPILFRFLDAEIPWRRAVVMLQDEVARRLAAEPGEANYGRLTVTAGAAARITPLFSVPPDAFRPPPKVVSRLVRLAPRDDAPSAEVRARLSQLTAAAFARRRKTLANALAAVPSARKAAERLGLDLAARPQAVPVETWVALARAIG